MSILEELRRNRMVFEALTGGQRESGPNRDTTFPFDWARELAEEPVSASLPELADPGWLDNISRRDVEAGPTPPSPRAFSLTRAPDAVDTAAQVLAAGAETVYPSGDRGPAAFGPGEALLDTLSRQMDARSRRQPQAIWEDEIP